MKQIENTKKKKKYGQNFLIDKGILSNIIKQIPCCDVYDDVYEDVYEIGAGSGYLTSLLLNTCKHVTAIEIDSDWYDFLLDKYKTEIANNKLTLINCDVLDYPLLGCVVGNLPYSISSKIISKILYSPIDYAVFMLQKEVVERIRSNRCRLGICVGAFYDFQYICKVPNTAFSPRPKVNSAVFTLKLHKKYKINYTKLDAMTDVVFRHPRKQLSWIIKDYVKFQKNENQSYSDPSFLNYLCHDLYKDLCGQDFFDNFIKALDRYKNARAEEVPSEFFYDLALEKA